MASVIQGQAVIHFTSNFYVETKSRGAVFPEGKVQDAQMQGSLSELNDIDAEQPVSSINNTNTSKPRTNSKITFSINKVTSLSSSQNNRNPLPIARSRAESVERTHIEEQDNELL